MNSALRGVVYILCACTLVSLTSACGASECARAPSQTSASARGPLAELAWLAGQWRSVDDEGHVTLERWALPRGTSMLGNAETLEGERTTHWEQLRIEARPDGSVVFIASPAGQATTEFARAPSEGQVLELRNPEHDFPVLIRYSRQGDVLAARVEGADGEGFDIRYELDPLEER